MSLLVTLHVITCYITCHYMPLHLHVYTRYRQQLFAVPILISWQIAVFRLLMARWRMVKYLPEPNKCNTTCIHRILFYFMNWLVTVFALRCCGAYCIHDDTGQITSDVYNFPRCGAAYLIAFNESSSQLHTFVTQRHSLRPSFYICTIIILIRKKPILNVNL